MASSNDKTKEHFGFMEDIKDKLSDPFVIAGVIIVIILIIVAVIMLQKQTNSAASFTETATKYLLTNTPDLTGYN